MDKEQLRSFIRIKWMEGLSPKNIHETLQNTLQGCGPSYSTVKEWCNNFKWGRESVKHATGAGRPITTITPDMIDSVKDSIEENRRITVRQLAYIHQISMGSIVEIMHQYLHLQKKNARWVPKLLNAKQKQERVEASKENLGFLHKDRAGFLDRIVTQDETWCYHYTPESKQQSAEWWYPNEMDVEEAVNAYFDGCDSRFFSRGLEKLEDRYNKCIDVQGEYFED